MQLLSDVLKGETMTAVTSGTQKEREMLFWFRNNYLLLRLIKTDVYRIVSLLFCGLLHHIMVSVVANVSQEHLL
jgi:heme/copper-type cytochrome/quinol oxidase subunit 2